MSILKKFTSQTAIYGLPTIVGRLLNYLLTPLFTYQFTTTEFGMQAEIFTIISFFNILLSYGMETAFFRFYTKSDNKSAIYNTATLSLLASSFSFFIMMWIFNGFAAASINFSDHPNYLMYGYLILVTDAIAIVPFAYLRSENKAMKFALIKSGSIALNIILNVIMIGFAKSAYEKGLASGTTSWLGDLYDPAVGGVGYTLIINVISNVFMIVLLAKEWLLLRFEFDFKLWLQLIKYGAPLIILGFAGMINETFDRFIISRLLDPSIARSENGIYAACYKIAILMTVFTQTFRFAAEPFFFNHADNKDAKKIYAQLTKYFTIAASIIFLGVMMNLNWIQYFISAPFRAGLYVVPILLIANICIGVYYNLSIWYKLTGQTKYGAYITTMGAIITLILDFTLIPLYSYKAAAWATLIAYASMMVVSYYIGQKHYPVKYNLRSMLFFFFVAFGLYLFSFIYAGINPIVETCINNLLFAGYLFLIYKIELPQLKKNVIQA